MLTENVKVIGARAVTSCVCRRCCTTASSCFLLWALLNRRIWSSHFWDLAGCVVAVNTNYAHNITPHQTERMRTSANLFWVQEFPVSLGWPCPRSFYLTDLTVFWNDGTFLDCLEFGLLAFWLRTNVTNVGLSWNHMRCVSFNRGREGELFIRDGPLVHFVLPADLRPGHGWYADMILYASNILKHPQTFESAFRSSSLYSSSLLSRSECIIFLNVKFGVSGWMTCLAIPRVPWLAWVLAVLDRLSLTVIR